MLSGIWRPFCLGLNVLSHIPRGQWVDLLFLHDAYIRPIKFCIYKTALFSLVSNMQDVRGLYEHKLILSQREDNTNLTKEK